jgi:hypothetical protein
VSCRPIERHRRALKREACQRRPLAKAREKAGLRQRTRAQFVQAALDHYVHIAIVGSLFGPAVFTWAPTAPTIEEQLACDRSFKRAVRQNPPLVFLIAAEPRGRREGDRRPIFRSRPRPCRFRR